MTFQEIKSQHVKQILETSWSCEKLMTRIVLQMRDAGIPVTGVKHGEDGEIRLILPDGSHCKNHKDLFAQAWEVMRFCKTYGIRLDFEVMS